MTTRPTAFHRIPKFVARTLSVGLLIAVSTALPAMATPVQAVVEPSVIRVGHVGKFTLVSSDGRPVFDQMPDVVGLQWLSSRAESSRSLRIINGRRTNEISTTYRFKATEPGTVRIPPTPVRTGRATAMSAAVSFECIGANTLAATAPGSVLVGQIAEYKITCDQRPENLSLPKVDGLLWVDRDTPQVSSSTQFLNGRRTDSYVISVRFRAETPGILAIPPVGVTSGRQTWNTVPVTVSVESTADRFYMTAAFNGSDKPPMQLYPGEELVIDLTLFVRADIELSFRDSAELFPTPELDNVVFKDYSAHNELNSQFELSTILQPERNGRYGVVTDTQRIGRNRFTVYRWRTSVSAVSPGQLSGKFIQTVPIVRNNGSRGNPLDPFRHGFFNRTVIDRLEVVATVPVIEIVPLPPPPDDGIYTGLIGDWTMAMAVDQPETKVGQGLSLTLTITGKGNVEALRDPVIQAPGFSLYPAKISKDPVNRSATVEWPMIARSVESALPTFTFLSFSPIERRYIEHVFTVPLTVLPGEESVTGPLVNDYEANTEPSSVATPAKNDPVTDILYIKKSLSPYVKLPLIANVRGPGLGILVAGPMLYVAVLLLAVRRDKLAGSEAFRRRRDANKRRRHVFDRIRNAPPDELPTVIRNELTPYLLALLDLPPGTTTRELLSQIDDPELVAMLEQAEAGGFMPGCDTTIDATTLLSKVKAIIPLCVIAMLVNTPSVDAQHPPAADVMNAAAVAYDNVDLAQAERLFKQLEVANSGNSALLYNLGSIAYRKGEYGRSLAYFERARRLNPRDSDIIENLNFIRAQLGLPPVFGKNSPTEVISGIRDHLRPDEWLLIAAALWFGSWFLLALGRWWRTRQWWPALTCFVVAIVASSAAAAQWRATYRPDQAVIVTPDAAVFSVPQHGGVTQAPTLVLESGKYVDIREERTDWVRIRVGQDEGWVKRNAIVRFWR